jgi:hypothetical protein
MFFSPFAVPIVAIIMVGLFPILRATARRMDAQARQGSVPADVTDRLERIERALESVAIEVERISEGQRFTTKLLSDRTSASAPAAHAIAAQPQT